MAVTVYCALSLSSAWTFPESVYSFSLSYRPLRESRGYCLGSRGLGLPDEKPPHTKL